MICQYQKTKLGQWSPPKISDSMKAPTQAFSQHPAQGGAHRHLQHHQYFREIYCMSPLSDHYQWSWCLKKIQFILSHIWTYIILNHIRYSVNIDCFTTSIPNWWTHKSRQAAKRCRASPRKLCARNCSSRPAGWLGEAATTGQGGKLWSRIGWNHVESMLWKHVESMLKAMI